MKKVSVYIDMYNFLAYCSKFLKGRAFIDFVNVYKFFLKEDEELAKLHIYGGGSMSGLLYKLSHYDHIEITEENTGWDMKEKRTDVNLAVDLVVGAYKNEYDKAVILSGDSDFIRAVSAAREVGKDIYIATTKGEGMKNARKIIDESTGSYELGIDFFKRNWLKGKPFLVKDH